MGVAGEWLTPEETDVVLASAEVAVVHGPRGGLRVLRGSEVADYWRCARQSCEVPGRCVPGPVRPDGTTVAVHTWRRDGAVLVGFLESC